jgi:hypothetical protein
MSKIKMKNPLVEMDGDEMTRIIWKQVKDILITPFVDLKTEYFDLGLKNRDLTNDQITLDAAIRTRELGVAVKCATITPNAQRMEEYRLKKMWKSPNGTIRAILDGTVFRTPILVDCIQPFVSTWRQPITIARHAYGDIYSGSEMLIEEPCTAELVLTNVRMARFDGSKFINSTDRVFFWACTIPISRSSVLLVPVLNMPSTLAKICGFPPRTPSRKHMTTGLRIFLPRYSPKNSKRILKKPASRIFIL